MSEDLGNTKEMANSYSADVIIVGAGIVGASLACKLGVACGGLRILLVDAGLPLKEYSGNQFDPRVVALNDASTRFLKGIGVWGTVKANRACHYEKMHVWDGEGTASIDFDCEELNEPHLGHIVENSVLTRALSEKLNNLSSVTVRTPAIVNDLELLEGGVSGVSLQLDSGEVLTAPLVIAADGARSHLRDMAGIFVREWSYEHTAIVTTVKTEKSHDFTAFQRFTQYGPLAFLPLRAADGATNYCSIVWSLDESVADQKMALPEKQFNQHLSEAIEHVLGEVQHSDERYAIPLVQRHAISYIKPGVALVGDAAHTIHPLAGQGVNLGLYDVGALSEEIIRAVDRQVPLTDMSILKRYQRARKAHNLSAMGAMEGFKRLFGTDSLWSQLIRNRGMSFVDGQAWLKKQLMQLARG